MESENNEVAELKNEIDRLKKEVSVLKTKWRDSEEKRKALTSKVIRQKEECHSHCDKLMSTERGRLLAEYHLLMTKHKIRKVESKLAAMQRGKRIHKKKLGDTKGHIVAEESSDSSFPQAIGDTEYTSLNLSPDSSYQSEEKNFTPGNVPDNVEHDPTQGKKRQGHHPAHPAEPNLNRVDCSVLVATCPTNPMDLPSGNVCPPINPTGHTIYQMTCNQHSPHHLTNPVDQMFSPVPMYEDRPLDYALPGDGRVFPGNQGNTVGTSYGSLHRPTGTTHCTISQAQQTSDTLAHSSKPVENMNPASSSVVSNQPLSPSFHPIDPAGFSMNLTGLPMNPIGLSIPILSSDQSSNQQTLQIMRAMLSQGSAFRQSCQVQETIRNYDAESIKQHEYDHLSSKMEILKSLSSESFKRIEDKKSVLQDKMHMILNVKNEIEKIRQIMKQRGIASK